jgi:hypothetical protein
MTPSRLDPPVALDLVPAEHVREIIATTDVELTQLERSAADARAAAEHAEHAASEAGLDSESSAWTMVRLQRFLDGLRDETQREVDTMLELARQQAMMRRAEGRAGGEQDELPKRPMPQSPGAFPAAAAPAVAPEPVRPPVVSPAPVPAPAPIPPSAPERPAVARTADAPTVAEPSSCPP